MKHEPYRQWILNDGLPSERQGAELREHLAGCEACRNLQDDWHKVRALIEGSEAVGPPAGFSRRFQIRLAQQRAARARRQVAVSLAVIVIGALASALLLLDVAADAVVGGLAESLRTFAAARQAVAVAGDILSGSLSRIPAPPGVLVLPGFTVALLGLIAAVYAGLGGLWAVAVYRFSDPNPSGGSK